MRQSLIAFAAIYAVVLGTSSCGGNNNTQVPVLGNQAQYQQIERLARPAVKELFQQFNNHDSTNRTSPYAQPYSSQTSIKRSARSRPAWPAGRRSPRRCRRS